MNVVCIIPARGGSKGIPGKNIMEMAGKPLIAWSIEHARQSRWIGDAVFVSSDSDEILAVAEQSGARVIERPAELSHDRASSEEALAHALAKIERSNPSKIDYVVFLQATSPVRHPEDIDNAIDVIVREKADSLFSAQPLKDYFIWKKQAQGLVSVNYDYKNRLRRQDLETSFLENGSIYVFRPSVLVDQKNRLGGKIAVYEMDRLHSQQIDEMEDAEYCSYLLRKLYS